VITVDEDKINGWHVRDGGRPRLFTIDRLLWVWFYRLWPRCLDSMVLVEPATVVQWHRQGFRLFWRWRSRSGRPSVNREVRDLIRQMNAANPLWGAPRIHGEFVKLGIEISQATVAKYMVRRRGTPSPTWRSFLPRMARNSANGSLRWESPRLSVRRDHLGRMDTSNARSVRFAVSASTTS